MHKNIFKAECICIYGIVQCKLQHSVGSHAAKHSWDPASALGGAILAGGDSVSGGREGVGRRSRIPDRLPLSRNVPPTFTTIYIGVLTPIMSGGILAEMIKGKSGLSGKRIKK